MKLQENFPLTRCNTFGIPARARYFAAPQSEDELVALLAEVAARALPLTVLGGGSNVVLAGDVDGLVLHPAMRGIRCVEEGPEHVLVEAAAGEVWHDFVQHTLAQGWYGLENLSLIPGSVGAAPIQNIGAYGVEITDRFHSLTAVEIASGQRREFSHAQCRFGYRDSIFKQDMQGLYIITRVRFRLPRQPQLVLGYGDIQAELAARGVAQPTPLDVAAAVIAIRQRKLPAPEVLGNAGSFFKNPVLPVAEYERLKQVFPGVVAYPQDGGVKLAAGWLIDQAGWKGRRLGPVGAYEKQALVLVNHGGATGADVLAAAHAIQADVQAKFGVMLEMEPQVIGGA